MTALTLFGLALAPLYSAIAEVESHRGGLSDNVYQIRKVYVKDLQRIYPSMGIMEWEVHDKHLSETMMFLYWKHYGRLYAERTGGLITYEVLARIHNGGPRGYEKIETKPYWERVRKELVKMGVMK